MRVAVSLLLFAFLRAPGDEPSSSKKSRTKSEPAASSRKPEEEQSTKIYSRHARLSSDTRPVYLNAFYQVFHSFHNLKTSLQKLEITRNRNNSSLVIFIRRVQRTVTNMEEFSRNVKNVVPIDDIIMKSLSSPPATLDELSLVDFTRIFVHLLSRGWAKLQSGPNQVESFLGGAWGRSAEATSTNEEAERINPIVLTMGRKSFVESFEDYISARIGQKLTSKNRPKVDIAPFYLLFSLNWEVPPTVENSNLLPYLLPTDYLKVKFRGGYIAHALIFRSQNGEKYMTQIHKHKDWVLFYDEINVPIMITNDLKGWVAYKDENWECVMIIYKTYTQTSIKGFDISG